MHHWGAQLTERPIQDHVRRALGVFALTDALAGS
jgi:hypothetical protein